MTDERPNSEGAERSYEKKYGAVAFAGNKRPGFAVVVGMEQMSLAVAPQHRRLYVLDEFESYDTEELLRQCRVLELKHGAQRWIGDWRKQSAQEVISQMNEEAQTAHPYTESRRRFDLTHTSILDNTEDPYDQIVSTLKRLLSPGDKLLRLEGSKIGVYATEIHDEDVYELKFGDFPALEAVVFAVTELIQDARHELDRRMSPRVQPAYGRRHVFDFGKTPRGSACGRTR